MNEVNKGLDVMWLINQVKNWGIAKKKNIIGALCGVGIAVLAMKVVELSAFVIPWLAIAILFYKLNFRINTKPADGATTKPVTQTPWLILILITLAVLAYFLGYLVKGLLLAIAPLFPVIFGLVGWFMMGKKNNLLKNSEK